MKKFSLISSCQRMIYKYSYFTIIATITFAYTLLVFDPQARAQNLPSTAELENYADTLLRMEPLRQEAFEKIKKIMPKHRGGVPTIACNDRNSINTLPNQARGVAVNFCQRYQSIVSENDMTIDRFNQITEIINGNENLQDSIYDLLLNSQKQENE